MHRLTMTCLCLALLMGGTALARGRPLKNTLSPDNKARIASQLDHMYRHYVTPPGKKGNWSIRATQVRRTEHYCTIWWKARCLADKGAERKLVVRGMLNNGKWVGVIDVGVQRDPND